MGTNVTMGIAFIAGLASFFSPCVFSLVPAYISYLSGRSAASESGTNRLLTLTHGLAFVLGFSLVFVLLGVAASLLGGLLYSMSDALTKIGGIVVIIFGLQMTGVLRKVIYGLHNRLGESSLGAVTGFLVRLVSYLDYDLRPQTAPDRRAGYMSSALMGVFFSAGWAPCTGPVLGSILTLALNTANISQGAVLLTAYSAGLAIPFLFAATQIGLITTAIRRYGKVMHYVEIGMGILLIIIGIMLFQGTFAQLSILWASMGTVDELAVGPVVLAVFLALLVIGLLPGYIAYRKGRSFIDWWFFGIGLFPVALVMALRLPDEAKAEPHQAKNTLKS